MVKNEILFLSQSLINEHVYLKFTVIQHVNIYDLKCNIPKLRGDNYMVWKERVFLHFGWMDIDYAVRKDEPHPISKTSTANAISLYEKWQCPFASL